MIGPHSDKRMDIPYSEEAFIRSILSLVPEDMRRAVEKDLRLMLEERTKRTKANYGIDTTPEMWETRGKFC